MQKFAKITIEVPAELNARMKERIPWGIRKHILAGILETVMDAIEKDGDIVMGALMAKSFRLEWVPPTTEPVRNSDSTRDAITEGAEHG